MGVRICSAVGDVIYIALSWRITMANVCKVLWLGKGLNLEGDKKHSLMDVASEFYEGT